MSFCEKASQFTTLSNSTFQKVVVHADLSFTINGFFGKHGRILSLFKDITGIGSSEKKRRALLLSEAVNFVFENAEILLQNLLVNTNAQSQFIHLICRLQRKKSQFLKDEEQKAHSVSTKCIRLVVSAYERFPLNEIEDIQKFVNFKRTLSAIRSQYEINQVQLQFEILSILDQCGEVKNAQDVLKKIDTLFRIYLLLEGELNQIFLLEKQILLFFVSTLIDIYEFKIPVNHWDIVIKKILLQGDKMCLEHYLSGIQEHWLNINKKFVNNPNLIDLQNEIVKLEVFYFSMKDRSEETHLFFNQKNTLLCLFSPYLPFYLDRIDEIKSLFSALDSTIDLADVYAIETLFSQRVFFVEASTEIIMDKIWLEIIHHLSSVPDLFLADIYYESDSKDQGRMEKCLCHFELRDHHALFSFVFLNAQNESVVSRFVKELSLQSEDQYIVLLNVLKEIILFGMDDQNNFFRFFSSLNLLLAKIKEFKLEHLLNELYKLIAYFFPVYLNQEWAEGEAFRWKVQVQKRNMPIFEAIEDADFCRIIDHVDVVSILNRQFLEIDCRSFPNIGPLSITKLLNVIPTTKLLHAFNEERLSNVKICCPSDRKLLVHSSILSRMSYFEKLLQGGFQESSGDEIEFTDVEDFDFFYVWMPKMYHSRVQIDERAAENLLKDLNKAIYFQNRWLVSIIDRTFTRSLKQMNFHQIRELLFKHLQFDKNSYKESGIFVLNFLSQMKGLFCYKLLRNAAKNFY